MEVDALVVPQTEIVLQDPPVTVGWMCPLFLEGVPVEIQSVWPDKSRLTGIQASAFCSRASG